MTYVSPERLTSDLRFSGKIDVSKSLDPLRGKGTYVDDVGKGVLTYALTYVGKATEGDVPFAQGVTACGLGGASHLGECAAFRLFPALKKPLPSRSPAGRG